MTTFERPPADFYAAVGGAEFFRTLVHRFYAGVAGDPVLRPMYPEEDLTGAEDRLRMRHHPFAVTLAARDRWLVHMRAAIDSLDMDPAYEAHLWRYMEMAAHSMVNTPG